MCLLAADHSPAAVMKANAGRSTSRLLHDGGYKDQSAGHSKELGVHQNSPEEIAD